MATRTSRPWIVVLGGLIFVAAPFLWSKAANTPVNTRFAGICGAIAVLFFYMAMRDRRVRRDED